MEYTHPKLAIEYQGDATKILAGTEKKLPRFNPGKQIGKAVPVRSQIPINYTLH